MRNIRLDIREGGFCATPFQAVRKSERCWSGRSGTLGSEAGQRYQATPTRLNAHAVSDLTFRRISRFTDAHRASPTAERYKRPHRFNQPERPGTLQEPVR